MPVHTVRNGPLATTSFIGCDKRSDINRKRSLTPTCTGYRR